MPCDLLPLPGGGRAIVCTTGRRTLPRCACGRVAPLLCDWKLEDGQTCDAALCARCSTTPAPDKDLCPRHADAFENWKAGRRAANGEAHHG